MDSAISFCSEAKVRNIRMPTALSTPGELIAALRKNNNRVHDAKINQVQVSTVCAGDSYRSAATRCVASRNQRSFSCRSVAANQEQTVTRILVESDASLFSFSHVGGRNARFMKAILVHRIGLANEDMRRNLVFGAPKFSERREQRQIIKSLQRQRETQRSRLRTIFRTGHYATPLPYASFYNRVIMAL